MAFFEYIIQSKDLELGVNMTKTEHCILHGRHPRTVTQFPYYQVNGKNSRMLTNAPPAWIDVYVANSYLFMRQHEGTGLRTQLGRGPGPTGSVLNE